MKYRLMGVLCCPLCSGNLKLTVLEERNVSFRRSANVAQGEKPYGALSCPHADEGDCVECATKDIREGILRCKSCSQFFPIVNGVPRMLAASINQFPDFLSKWQTLLEREFGRETVAERMRSTLHREYRQVARHFQSQWQYWGKLKKSFGRDVQGSLDYLLWTLTPEDSAPEFFEKKLILDAGCGHGKFVKALSRKNAEVVGIDITRAIDLCEDYLGEEANVHLIQADVIHPALRRESFDYVFSNGVIHHTPNTLAAFQSLAKLPKKNGVYAVWVYPFRSKWWELVQTNLRQVTTRLPPSILKVLSYIPVPLLSIRQFRAYSGTSLRNASWAECAQVVFDFYGPKYQTHHTEREVTGWFESEHYERIHVGPDPTSVIGKRLGSSN
jgi:uncharacterized protein YbaR (Trm112 family)/2-polyprenyl-3-methyl-5-hydroxy-6-metoxy-1,4-benzoquinol methylase